MRVLAAIDETEGSAAVIEEIARRTWRSGDTVRFLTVIGRLEATTNETFDPSFVSSGAERAKRLLERAARELERRGAAVSTALVAGRPATAILRAARSWRADFVHVGRRGRETAAHRGLGTNARTIVCEARCSVGVVRRRPAVRLDRPDRHILLATDGSPCSLDAVRSVADRAWPGGTRIEVVASTEEAASAARDVLEDARLEVSAVLLDPDPRRKVLAMTGTAGADLVALGVDHPRDALEAAELAECTLEVIRAARQEDV